MAKDDKKKGAPAEAEINWVSIYHMGTKLNVLDYVDEEYASGEERYGNAKFRIYYLYDENYGITDMLFDLRKVYDKYGKSKGSYHDFLASINSVAKKTYFSCEWKNVDDVNFEALGIALCYDENNGKPLAHFGDILVDLKNAIDSALGLSNNELTLEKVDKYIYGGLNGGRTMKIMIFFLLLMAAGIVMIFRGTLVWGWIATIAGFLVGGFLFLGYILNMNDYKKQKIHEDFKHATRSRFK